MIDDGVGRSGTCIINQDINIIQGKLLSLELYFQGNFDIDGEFSSQNESV